MKNMYMKKLVFKNTWTDNVLNYLGLVSVQVVPGKRGEVKQGHKAVF